MHRHNLHIIIAEDDLDDAEIITDSFLKHPAFSKVDLVKNGLELLQFLRDKGNHQPDMILTDLNMPIMNGIDALKAICDDKDIASIPAFVYSTSVNPIYEAACKEIGTRGFLVKPMEIKGFYEIPDKMLESLIKPD